MRLFQLSILLLLVFLLNACTTLSCAYFGANCPISVNVSGYTKGENTDLKNSKFFVFENYEVQNPFLEQEIGAKLKKALEYTGFTTVNKLEESDYVALFRYGIDQGQTYSQTYSYQSTRLNVFTGQIEPTTEVGSSLRTIYNRHFILYLYKTEGLSEKSLPVWMGDVTSKGSSPDLRDVIDYLIIGAFENFGEDTKGQKSYFYQPPAK